MNGNDLDLRMMIHQSQAGCVIGRGGQKIKEIRDVSHLVPLKSPEFFVLANLQVSPLSIPLYFRRLMATPVIPQSPRSIFDLTRCKTRGQATLERFSQLTFGPFKEEPII